MELVKRFRKRLTNLLIGPEDLSIENRLNSLHDDLLRSKLLSIPVSKSEIGHLDNNSRFKSKLLMINILITIVRFLSVVLLSGFGNKHVFSGLLDSLGSNTYKPLGSLPSLVLSALQAVAHTTCLFDRYLYSWGESKGILHHVYHLYRVDRVINISHEESNKSFGRMMKYFMIGMRLVRYNSAPLYQMMIIGLYIMSNLESTTALPVVMSSIWLINELVSVHFNFMSTVQNHCLMAVSTKLLMMKIEKLQNIIHLVMNDEKWTSSNAKKISADVNHVYGLIQEQNLLKQYLLRNILFLLCPYSAILMYITTIDIPVWLKQILLGGTIPLVFLIILSLYYNGRLLTVSRSLLISLYSMQVRMSFVYQRNVVARTKLRSVIKLISSSRQPLGYTLPDGSLLTPMTSLHFLGSSISGTFLLLTNKIIRDFST